MANHIPFIDGDIAESNRVPAAWLNGVNDLVYGIGDPTRGAALLQYIPAGSDVVTQTVQNALRQRIIVTDYTTLTAALTAASGKALHILTSVAVPASLTIPTTVELSFELGGSLVPASGQVITLNCSIAAGFFKIFDTSAGGSFQAGDTFKNAVFPEWFGALGNGSTDDTLALQTALTFCDTALQKRLLELSAKVYMFSNIVVPAQVHIAGQGMWNSLLKRIPGSTGSGVTDGGNATKITFTGWLIDGNGVDAVGLELGNNGVQWGNEGYFDDFGVRDCGTATCAIINGNVGQIKSILCQTSGTGSPVLYINGGGNRIGTAVVVSTSTCAVGLELRAGSTDVTSVHIEGRLTNPLDITGPDNLIKHMSFSAANGLTVTAVVHFPPTNAVRNIIEHLFVIPATATISNIVRDENSSTTWAWTAAWPHYNYAQGGAKRFVSQMGTATFPTATSVAVNFPRTEPNTSYRVALSPLANQTMWVTNKTTSGFTLNTATAGSTASCDWSTER